MAPPAARSAVTSAASPTIATGRRSHVVPRIEHTAAPALLAGAAVCSIRGTTWLRRPVAIVGLAALVTADLAAGGAIARGNRMMTNPLDGIDRLTPVDLTTYYRTGGAATFLQQHLHESPSRFFGYAPDVGGQPLAYTFRFAD